MSHKIETSPVVSVSSARRVGAAYAVHTDSAAQAQGLLESRREDALTLTDGARLLGELQQQLTQGAAPFDTARVERLRQQVQDGSYATDASRIADRLLRMEADFRP